MNYSLSCSIGPVIDAPALPLATRCATIFVGHHILGVIVSHAFHTYVVLNKYKEEGTLRLRSESFLDTT
jgi:hypothetical protein